jgi:cbb3-type cytochrome oxidase subunit 3
VIGVVLFIPFADFFGLLATGLWLIGASVVLYRKTAEPRYAAQPQVA